MSCRLFFLFPQLVHISPHYLPFFAGESLYIAGSTVYYSSLSLMFKLILIFITDIAFKCLIYLFSVNKSFSHHEKDRDPLVHL